MRISDRSGSGRRLQTVFLPAEPKPVFPTEISDEIILTHPVIPPMVGFKEGRFFHQTKTSNAGISSVLSDLVPTDRYWWIQALDVTHNDTVTPRRVFVNMRDTGSNDVTIFSQLTTVAAAIPVILPRPFLLPNDTRFVAVLNGIGGAFTVTIRFFFYELLHAEINPSV